MPIVYKEEWWRFWIQPSFRSRKILLDSQQPIRLMCTSTGCGQFWKQRNDYIVWLLCCVYWFCFCCCCFAVLVSFSVNPQRKVPGFEFGVCSFCPGILIAKQVAYVARSWENPLHYRFDLSQKLKRWIGVEKKFDILSKYFEQTAIIELLNIPQLMKTKLEMSEISRLLK